LNKYALRSSPEFLFDGPSTSITVTTRLPSLSTTVAYRWPLCRAGFGNVTSVLGSVGVSVLTRPPPGAGPPASAPSPSGTANGTPRSGSSAPVLSQTRCSTSE
jgi:hypothetical protein